MGLSRHEKLLIGVIFSVLGLAAVVGGGLLFYMYSQTASPAEAGVASEPMADLPPENLEVLPEVNNPTPIPAATSEPIVEATQPVIPTPEPPPTTTAIPPTVSAPGGFDDPVSIGSLYTFPGLGNLKVVNSQWIPGQTGFAIVYLSLYCDRPPNQICDTPDFMLHTIGSSGNGYPQEFDSAIPGPGFTSIFDGDVYGGGTKEGYAGFLITNPEDWLLMRVELFLDLNTEVYFRIS